MGFCLIHHWFFHPTHADEPGQHGSLHPTHVEDPDQEYLSSQPMRVSNGVVSRGRGQAMAIGGVFGEGKVYQNVRSKFYKTLDFWSWCSRNILLINFLSVR